MLLDYEQSDSFEVEMPWKLVTILVPVSVIEERISPTSDMLHDEFLVNDEIVCDMLFERTAHFDGEFVSLPEVVGSCNLRQTL